MKKLAVIFILLGLSGCGNLWDDYKYPETKTPENWNAKIDENGAYPDAKWWEEFNSAELTSLVEEARKNNYDLKAAVARVHEADAQAKIAGAALLPSVDVGADASKTQHGRAATPAASRTTSSYNATATASYELDFWGKNWSAEKAAEALAKGSRYDKQTVLLTITSSVADIYFDMLATKKRLEVAESNLATAKKLLDSMKRRQAAGIAAALDVVQQESVVEAQDATLPPLKLELAQDRSALAILLGKLPEDVKLAEEKFADMKAPKVSVGLPSELLQRRPDVQFAEAQLIAADANITNARAQFFPDISLTAGAGYASNALSTLVSPGSSLFTLGASLTQPIFEGGRLSGLLGYNKARYDELLNGYHKAVISAFSDVENSLAAVEQAKDGENIATKAEKTAKKAFNLSQEQFKNGIVDITTTLNTQRTLFAAENSLVQAKLATLQATVGLYQALGGGWKDSGKR